MSKPAREATPLTLHLYRSGAELPAGVPLHAAAGARATLVHGAANGSNEGSAASDLHVHLALPERSRAELRWVADQILRRLSGLTTIGQTAIRCGEGVDDDLLLTLGLDMHQRSAAGAAPGAAGHAGHVDRPA